MITKQEQKTWFNSVMYGMQGDKAVIESIKNSGMWEQSITALIVNNVRENDVVLDIGANIGYYSLLLSKIVGEYGRVHCYEAVPDIYEVLSTNAKNNLADNINLYNRAASNIEGEIEFTYFKNNPGASSQTSIWSDEDKNGFKNRMEVVGGEVETRTAQATTLDHHLLPQLSKLDFIKFDIEGGEGCALKGMQQILQRFSKVNIVSEFLVGNDECDVLSTYNTLAHEYGYNLYEILATFPSNSLTTLEARDYYCLSPVLPERLNKELYIDALFLSSEKDTSRIGRICNDGSDEWTDRSIEYGETPTHTDSYEYMIQAFQDVLSINHTTGSHDTSDL